ncbi:TPA: glycerate kinase, partial [Streptococcus suis]
MRILIAPDSFKESLSATDVAQAIKQGFSKVYPQASYDLLPLGDGGE